MHLDIVTIESISPGVESSLPSPSARGEGSKVEELFRQAGFKPILKTPAKPVTFPLSQEDRALIAAMEKKLYELGGVGLAAPQVNYAKQIIAIYIPEEASLLRDFAQTYPMHVMINPSYQAYSGEKVSDFEACYSVASKAGKVPRFQQIQLTYQDENGHKHSELASGFYARVLQHEIDHLEGTLITDRLTPDCTQGTVEEMMKLRRESLPDEKKRLFDEVMVKKLRK
ncbi:peptide deformylase [Legionella impletisoli]|uniref:Peptide deformylase n=2 Tax=Legionella impletisoli TaxID=343510 RepID=A0A917JPV0_9GAMM|nr:peptide deformylase [Legionella impletisoli]GGI80382.1 peptide deformylase [Legionella impletisoli]